MDNLILISIYESTPLLFLAKQNLFNKLGCHIQDHSRVLHVTTIFSIFNLKILKLVIRESINYKLFGIVTNFLSPSVPALSSVSESRQKIKINIKHLFENDFFRTFLLQIRICKKLKLLSEFNTLLPLFSIVNSLGISKELATLRGFGNGSFGLLVWPDR